MTEYASELRLPQLSAIVQSAENALAPHLWEGYDSSSEAHGRSWLEFVKDFMRVVDRSTDKSQSTRAGIVSTHDAFLTGIYDCARTGESQRGSVTIMQYLDGLLHADKAPECDDILRAVSIESLPVRMVLAFVTVTNLIPETSLPYKSEFRRLARERLNNEVGRERAASILGEV